MMESLTGKRGEFVLYSDLAQVDTLQIHKTATGEHKVSVLYDPKTFSQALAQSITEANRLVVATIHDPKSTAIFQGGEVEMGILGYRTRLSKRTDATKTEWLISGITPTRISPSARKLTTVLNTPYRLFELQSQLLNQRLGELRDYPKDYGLYFRYSISRHDLNSYPLIESKDLSMGFLLGWDSAKRYKGRKDFFGLAGEFILLDNDSHIQAQSYGANLYYTLVFDHGLYIDTLLRYAYTPVDSDLHRFSTHSLGLSLELGSRFGLGVLYLQPLARLEGGAILGSDTAIKDPNGIPITAKLHTQFPFLARPALYLGYEWNGKVAGDLKLGITSTYSLSNGGTIDFQDPYSRIKEDFGSDLDVGVSVLGSVVWDKALRLYLSLDASFLGAYREEIGFGMGVRWSFGETIIPPPPSPTASSPATPSRERYKIHYKYTPSKRDIPRIKSDDIANMWHYEKPTTLPRAGSRNRDSKPQRQYNRTHGNQRPQRESE